MHYYIIYNVVIIKFSTDLFATDEAASSKPKKSKTGTKKKSKKATSEPKDYSMFDADAPSIFDWHQPEYAWAIISVTS